MIFGKSERLPPAHLRNGCGAEPFTTRIRVATGVPFMANASAFKSDIWAFQEFN